MEHQWEGPTIRLHRYIDNEIGITDMSQADLSHFIKNFHSAIKLTFKISTSHVNFLDISITFEPSCLRTSVHYKPTDDHSFLICTSFHPSACRD